MVQTYSVSNIIQEPSKPLKTGQVREPESVNVYGAQESIPPGYIGWRSISVLLNKGLQIRAQYSFDCLHLLRVISNTKAAKPGKGDYIKRKKEKTHFFFTKFVILKKISTLQDNTQRRK